MLTSRLFPPSSSLSWLSGVFRNALNLNSNNFWDGVTHHSLARISTTCPLQKKVIGRWKKSRKHDTPLTYEQFMKPHEIAHAKYWTSLNTANFIDFGLRQGRTITEDIFIRRFLTCTWHNLFVSEILIKRNGNMIRAAGIVQRSIPPRKMYFLLGYSEELLSHWIQCPVKLELQTVDAKKDVIYTHV